MPQQDLLLPWRTVLQNAALPLELKNIPKAKIFAKVSTLLSQFGLKGCEHHHISQLSGGMRQRVAFLRAILSGSNLLLLDEPFSALDAITKLSMQTWLLEQWQRWKQSILFITHDVNEALFLSDRIFVLSEASQSTQQLKIFNVPLKRPRNWHDLDSPPIISLRNKLFHTLKAYPADESLKMDKITS